MKVTTYLYLKNLIKERLGTLYRLVKEGHWTESQYSGVCEIVRGNKSVVDNTGRFRVAAVRLAEALNLSPQELFGIEARTEKYPDSKFAWRQSKNQALVRAIQGHGEYPSLHSFCTKNALRNSDYSMLCNLLRGTVHPRNGLTGGWRDVCVRVAAVLGLPIEELFPADVYGAPPQTVGRFYGRCVSIAGGAYRNKVLSTVILERYRSVQRLLQIEGMEARASDVSYLLRGQLSPKKEDGRWRKLALRLEQVLDIPAEVLFPDDCYKHLYSELDLERVQWAATVPLILYPNRPTFEQVLIQEESVKTALACLDQRMRLILEMRFGLNGQDESTFAQVAIVLDLTRSRVQQLEVVAFRKIRQKMCHQIVFL